MKQRGSLLDKQLLEIEALRESQRNARVEVAPLAAAVQAAVEREQAGFVLARRQGWVEPKDRMTWSSLARAAFGDRRDQPTSGDSSRLKRVLGLYARSDGSTATMIDYNTAVTIAHAAGIDPVAVGL